MIAGARTPGSFRDPSGFVFVRDGVLYRQVNRPYERDLALLRESGLHDALTADGLLVRADAVDAGLALEPEAVAVLAPERVPFVSYPYEWCFGQLRDSALLTLEVMDRAMERGMVLKDASAYNVQFLRGRPVLIDTLSFTAYREGEPWIAYRQFCQHFLAPLALMSYVDVRLAALMEASPRTGIIQTSRRGCCRGRRSCGRGCSPTSTCTPRRRRGMAGTRWRSRRTSHVTPCGR